MPEVLAIRGTFPISREERFLTRVNRLEDGTEYRSPEQSAPLYRWELELNGRSTAEVQQIESKFLTLGGRYGSFVFLDPLENLLLWSEDFGQPEWVKSAPADIFIDRDLPDPLGGDAAQGLTNSGASPNAVVQWIAAPPAGLLLTASVWLKAATGTNVPLSLTDGLAETYSVLAAVGSAWRRFSVTATFSSAGAGIQVGFRFDLPPSATVQVFGAQLMALGAPAPYVRTTTVSGFHPRCRFGDDVLAHRLAGSGHSDLRLSIVEFA